MPNDVKDMLGLPVEEPKIKKKRSKSETRSPPISSLKSPSRLLKPKAKAKIVPPTLDQKFDHQAKRNMIDTFLNTKRDSSPSKSLVPKSPSIREKNKAVIDALTEKITPAQPPPDAEPGTPGPKLNLADVIIAAAAAKTVKLKGTGIKTIKI